MIIKKNFYKIAINQTVLKFPYHSTEPDINLPYIVT